MSAGALSRAGATGSTLGVPQKRRFALAMPQQALLRERTTSGRMHASCLPVLLPHQFPTLQGFNQTPVPLRLSIPCALLRVHQRSASEPARAPYRYPDSAAAEVVAEWNAPSEQVVFPLGGNGGYLAPCRCGRGLGVGSVAPLSSAASATSWVVLRVQRTPHTGSEAGMESCRSGDDSGFGSCQQWIDRRLRLSTVLYASDWQFLVSRQERKSATVEHSSTLGVSASEREPAATADMEALSTFFPALHHGRYYATAQAFLRHCQHSDEHLVWCETDPLVSVEWVGTEEAPHQGACLPVMQERGKAAAEWGSFIALESAGARRSCVGVNRKRRRRWLSQRVRQCPRARIGQIAQPSCTEHQFAEASALCCSTVTRIITSVTALDSVFCAYRLTLKSSVGCLSASGEGLSAIAAAAAGIRAQGSTSSQAPLPPPDISREELDEALQSPSYASWYLALRPACRSALHTPHRAAAMAAGMGSAEESVGEAARRGAVQEVFLHGVAASLALWFCKQGKCRSTFASVAVCKPRLSEPSPTPLTASTGGAAVLVAALLRDWWDQLSQEAAQFFAVPATAAPAGPPKRRSRCSIAHQVWVSLQAWDRANSAPPIAAAAPPPAPLERLCVTCAIVVTFIHRSQERNLWWNAPGPTAEPSREYPGKADDDEALAKEGAVPSDANDGAAYGTGRAPSIDGVASNKSCTSAAGRLPRMSLNDSRRRHNDYRACMDLILQLLLAEQQQHWAK
ncbi:hypothetical protein LSCM1_00813 [Leishmania martiniquensis]|uniref:Uncharacterized protein n=1 Tax=Leishmania martiniquensis TaxID=1580590 RepID=A0A836G728_9TRYP|nr:hypothetical protein LSCM1_00813 [Leishmania martiniquensis]